ncbi:pirin family protein [Segniliparus rugosus]|uniref:pirin family protein n=1 Tax=Segniliparus rugosus TaxID=286804 RepID=UPI003CC77BBE
MQPSGARPPGPARPGQALVFEPREVPLGGPRAMTVRRTLPSRDRSLIGAWCFSDHYGPDDVRTTGGMDVPPHPHTGLQTVSWLFTGLIEHRDSTGVHAIVRPGELNLMTAGRGVSHTEVSTDDTVVLHGLQLWIALPRGARGIPPGFDHYAPPLVEFEGGQARVFLGSLLGSASPVPTHTPLLGAELLLDAGASARIAVDPAFEHGVLLDTEAAVVQGADLGWSELVYLGPGAESLAIANPTDRTARLMLLGGVPFGEEIVMWWNFIGESHEEIAAFREQWQGHDARFGSVDGYTPRSGGVDWLPAPALPTTRLISRRR